LVFKPDKAKYCTDTSKRMMPLQVRIAHQRQEHDGDQVLKLLDDGDRVTVLVRDDKAGEETAFEAELVSIAMQLNQCTNQRWDARR
jgi:hypothetical protein